MRRAAGSTNTLLLLAEDLDLGAPEAVNRLLAVADDEEVAVVAAKRVDDLPLPVVGVLIFVHEQGVELLLPEGAHVRVLAKEGEGQRFQVVKIQRLAFVLARAVERGGAGDEPFEGLLQLGQEAVGVVAGGGQLSGATFPVIAQLFEQRRDLLLVVRAAGPRLLAAAHQINLAQRRERPPGVCSDAGCVEGVQRQRPLQGHLVVWIDRGDLFQLGPQARYLGLLQEGGGGLLPGFGEPLLPQRQPLICRGRARRYTALQQQLGEHRMQPGGAHAAEQDMQLRLFDGPGEAVHDDFAAQPGGAAFLQHVEAGVDAGLRRVRAQDLGAQFVNGADTRGIETGQELFPVGGLRAACGHFPDVPIDGLAHAIAHLSRRLPREGDGGDAPGREPLFEQGEVAGDEAARFAGAGARRHDHRAVAQLQRRPLLVADCDEGEG